MKIAASATSTALLALIASTTIQPAIACDTPAYGNCLNGDGSLGCCPDDQLCQTWTPLIANCQPKPGACPSDLIAGYAISSEGLREFVDITLEGCCSKCSGDPECGAFMFINHRDGPPACYLQDLVRAKNAESYAQAGSIYGWFGRAPWADHTDKPSNATMPPAEETEEPVLTGCFASGCPPQNS